MKTRVPLAVAGACGALILLGQSDLLAGAGGQPDVIYSDCNDILYWGTIGGIRGYSLGSNTCNIGSANLLWGTSHNGTPTLAMNAYRLENGRLLQIGLSNAKHGTSAAASNGCGLNCNGQGGSVLGVGCLDVYSAGFNGGQSRLANRSQLNAWTGRGVGAPGGSGDEIFRRLQIANADFVNHQNAQFFVEGVYVATDDAGIFGNGYNNASHKRVTVSGVNLVVQGSMQVGDPAIFAWRDHGLGKNQPDPSVEVQTIDVPNEGRFYVLSKTTDLGDSWLYDYAIFNLNSDRSAGSFSVPSGSAAISDVGFHDVNYHSGEVYDNTDWNNRMDGSNVTWSSPQTHTENPNSNALRYGTMYNFWFTANAAPTDVEVEIGLFKPGTPSSVTVTVKGPSAPACPGDVSGNNVVDFADILAVLAAWGNAGGPEDVDGSGTVDFGDILFILANWGPCP